MVQCTKQRVTFLVRAIEHQPFKWSVTVCTTQKGNIVHTTETKQKLLVMFPPN